jgi:hypothetical protein
MNDALTLNDDARKWLSGMRELCDFLELHPLIANKLGWGQTINLFTGTKEEMATIARQVAVFDKKSDSGYYFSIDRKFTPHTLAINIQHDVFCEKVKIGTKKVKQFDPEALREATRDVPEVEIEEDVYEWRCPKSVLDPTS